MSDATKLIERMEKETGQRVDNNGGDNACMAGLFGALARALGESSHDPKDDVAAGYLLRHRMSAQYEREQQVNEMLAGMLIAGMSPDDLKDFLG